MVVLLHIEKKNLDALSPRGQDIWRAGNVERRRVVVTGMGIICPTGNSVEEAWANAAAGKTGIGPITRFDTSHLENHFGGEVKNFDPDEFLGKREARRTDRVTQLGVYAAQQAKQRLAAASG